MPNDGRTFTRFPATAAVTCSMISATAGSHPPHIVLAPHARCTSLIVVAPRCTAFTIVRSLTALQWQIIAMAQH